VLGTSARQSLEYGEWRVQPSISVPYAIPDPVIFRRVVGYAASIKGLAGYLVLSTGAIVVDEVASTGTLCGG
jgi:hypothetical protein